MTENTTDSSTESDNYKARFSLIRLLSAGIIFNSLIILAIPWIFEDLSLMSFTLRQQHIIWQIVFIVAALLILNLASRFRKFYLSCLPEDSDSNEYWQTLLKANLIPYVLLQVQIVLAILALLVFGDLLVYIIAGSSAFFLMLKFWPGRFLPGRNL